MKRREFIKSLSAAVLLIPATSLAQTPEQLQNVQTMISEKLEKALEFESADPDSVEWIDGGSDGTGCSMSNEQCAVCNE